MNKENVKLPEDHSQVCVWPGVLLGDAPIEEFEDYLKEELGIRVKYLETLMSGPDIELGKEVPETGGRSDIFFSIHKEDVSKFAIPRLSTGIKWLGDFIDNGGLEIHPKRIKDYKSK